MSQKKLRILALIFFTISILDVIGIISKVDWIRYLFKPLIILSLIALYCYSVAKVNKWYIIALIFSFMGDVLLLNKFNYFLFGIGSFLITQVLFIKIIAGQLEKSALKLKIIAVLPFSVFYMALMYILRGKLEEFFLPVAIYGITISVFGTVSLLNYLISKKSITSKYLLYGAIIFIASDSMIALNKFYEPHIFYPAAIIITYIMAQYLIFKFMMKLV